MQIQTRRLDVVIKGRVQDIGFRDFIEGTANLLNIKGYVFNDIDGSVKIICEGINESIDKFLQEINVKDSPLGITVESIKKKEIPSAFSLPSKFARLETDTLADISRKLDKGVQLLGNIGGDTSKLPGIDNKLSGIDTKLSGIDTTLSGVDNKLSGVDNKLSGIDTTLSGVDNKLSGIDNKLDTLSDIKGLLEKISEK